MITICVSRFHANSDTEHDARSGGGGLLGNDTCIQTIAGGEPSSQKERYLVQDNCK